MSCFWPIALIPRLFWDCVEVAHLSYLGVTKETREKLHLVQKSFKGTYSQEKWAWPTTSENMYWEYVIKADFVTFWSFFTTK
jgi:hypothetical protein